VDERKKIKRLEKLENKYKTLLVWEKYQTCTKTCSVYFIYHPAVGYSKNSHKQKQILKEINSTEKKHRED
jgi:hypothetical protein